MAIGARLQQRPSESGHRSLITPPQFRQTTMETETERSIRSRIAVKPIIMLTAYTVVIYNTAIVSLVVFSLFDAGEPALRESAAIMSPLPRSSSSSRSASR